jgi:hypothetical protein
MNVQRLGNGVTVILLLLCVLLSLLILQQWKSYLQAEPAADVTIETDKKGRAKSDLFLGRNSKSIQISQFSEILARPLFTEGRLPEEEPEPEQALSQHVGLPKLKLEGVAISPESRVAVVRDLTDNSLLRLSVGMIHQGWRVSDVTTEEAVLERDGESHRLPLELVHKPATKTTSRFRLPNRKK